MKAAVRAICRREAALGFALAGLAPFEVASADEAARVLARFAHAPDKGGIILVESSLYDALPATVRRQARATGLPVLVSFPGPSARAAAVAPEQELLEVVRRAVGYRLRLK